jgi:integrase
MAGIWPFLGVTMKRDLPAFCYRKGRKRYVYYIRGKHSQRIKSEPGTPEFAAEYARLLNDAAPPVVRSMAKLIELYRKSAKWATLSHNTRRSYERSLAFFEQKFGKQDPALLRRVHINQIRDKLAEKPTDANRKIGALSVLLEHAINIGWMDKNPAKGVSRLPTTGRKRTSWPVEEAPPRTLLLFELLIGTGQRIGDVLSLRWSDLDGDGFNLTQGKTGTRLYIPLTARLRMVLATAPRKGLFIVAQDNGLRLSYQLAWKDIMAVREKIGAKDYDIHGLRYSAAAEIASIPGMTAEHVKAITGHTDTAMVHLYAGPEIQRARAKEAQKARGNGRETDRESGSTN